MRLQLPMVGCGRHGALRAVPLVRPHDLPSGTANPGTLFGISYNLALPCRVALISYREKRRWLFTWASIYAIASGILTAVTYTKGPDSHDIYGCSVPLSLWALFLFITTLSYYTTDYMQRGQMEADRGEKYVYDPKVTLLSRIPCSAATTSDAERDLPCRWVSMCVRNP